MQMSQTEINRKRRGVSRRGRVLAAGLACAAGLPLPAWAETVPALSARAVQPEAPAEASRDEAALEVLRSSVAALAELDNLTLEVSRTMVVTDDLAPENAAFASVRLGSRGTIRATRDTEGRWVYRIEGFADNIGIKDAYQISIHREPTVISWLDYEDERQIVARPTLARGAYVASEESFAPRYFFDDEPLKPELDAPTVRSLGAQAVEGELCEVVEIEYGEQSRVLPHRIYFGAQDRLPRLIVRVMIPGFEEHIRVTSVDTSTRVDRDLIRIQAPSGWGTEYRPMSLDPSRQRDPSTTLPPSTGVDAPAGGEAAVGGLPGDMIPDFSSITLLGEEVSRADLLGKPTVMVFWTSWIPDAATTLDDMKTLVDAYGDSVNVVSFTIRERQPDSAFNMLAEAGLESVPLIIEAREATVAMNVLRAPTFVVVDSDGIVTYRGDRYVAEQTVAGVRSVVDALLEKSGQ